MRIPNKIQIAGKQIDIKFVNHVDIDYDWGKASYAKGLIEIANHLDIDTTCVTFFHEVLHHIFEAMGEDDLRNNEKLIHGLANYLHQIFQQVKK